jgi:hypothetical protein
MFLDKNKVFILPCDGTPEGYDEPMTEPRTGYFAVKFGKGQLERALFVFRAPAYWQINLDGFLVAPASSDWREAFGDIYKTAQKFGGILLGRVISVDQYVRLVKARAADKERGIDLSGRVDLNTVEIPSFQSKEK